jgi:thiazole/oxazole-forming peptide maturase SagC family component
MSSNYRIKRYFTTIYHSLNDIEFRFGVWNPTSYNVNDSSESGNLASIIKLLDGTMSTKEIAKKIDIRRDEIEGLIDHLLSINVLEKESGSAMDSYLDNIQLPFHRSDSIVNPETPVIIIGSEMLQEEIMKQSGIEMTAIPHDSEQWKVIKNPNLDWLDDGLKFQEKLELFAEWKGHLAVVALDIINPLIFKVLNKVFHELEIPWIHAALDGPFVFVGPTIVSGSTSCYQCLEKRILMNLREVDSYVSYKKLLIEGKMKVGEPQVGRAIHGILAAHTAFELMNLKASGNSFTQDKIMSIYLPTMEVSYNEVLKVPGCTVCGSSLERDHSEMHFDMGDVLIQK